MTLHLLHPQVTTDRDLLAADLYRVMLERSAAAADRDAALQALAEATAQLEALRKGGPGVVTELSLSPAFAQAAPGEEATERAAPQGVE